MPNPPFVSNATRLARSAAVAVTLVVTSLARPLFGQPAVAPLPRGPLEGPEALNIVWGYMLDATPCPDGQNVVWTNGAWPDDVDGTNVGLDSGDEPVDALDGICEATNADVAPSDERDAPTPEAPQRPMSGLRGDQRSR
jgi:hypothetical protein